MIIYKINCEPTVSVQATTVTKAPIAAPASKPSKEKIIFWLKLWFFLNLSRGEKLFGIRFLIHYLKDSCFDPLSFSPQFMITWLNAHFWSTSDWTKNTIQSSDNKFWREVDQNLCHMTSLMDQKSDVLYL